MYSYELPASFVFENKEVSFNDMIGLFKYLEN
jgi:hypothetical protein